MRYLVISVCVSLWAGDYYASFVGSGSSCTYAAPCSLATAIGTSSPAGAGDTVWVRGDGCHAGLFTISKGGTSAAGRFTIRGYPGERACIEATGGNTRALYLPSTIAWVDVMDLEIQKTSPSRYNAQYSAPLDTPSGIDIHAPNSRVANLQIHDLSGGVGFWSPAKDSSVTGIVMWGNGGWTDTSDDFGHNIYIQHDDLASRKTIQSLFWMASRNTSWRFGGTESRPRYCNVTINSGIYIGGDDQFDGPTPRSGWVVSGNHWIRPGYTSSSWVTQINEVDNADSEDVVVSGNYWIGFSPYIQYWKTISFTNNTVWKPTANDVSENGRLWPAGGWKTNGFTSLTLSGNRYIKNNCTSGDNCFKYGIYQNNTWTGVTSTHATDGGNIVTRASLITPEIIYDTAPGQFSPRQCHVMVYNWGNSNTVPLDLSQCGYAAGDSYAIWDLQAMGDAAPLHSGLYAGGTVAVNAAYEGITQPRNGEQLAPFIGAPWTYTKTPKEIRAYIVKMRYDGRANTALAWRGAITDTVQAGPRKVDGTYDWGSLPVSPVACTDGRCTARVPQPVGDAYWRINGGVALKMAAR